MVVDARNFVVTTGDLWPPWKRNDHGPSEASWEQAEVARNNAGDVNQTKRAGQQAAIARCARRHSPRHLPFYSSAVGVEHEPRMRARAP